jgi:deoxyribose-phosphate aldolase
MGGNDMGNEMNLNASELAAYIDHTVLKPDADDASLDKLCDEARQYEFKSVCVNSSRVLYAASKLSETGVEICSVVGFPLGAMSSRAKALEAEVAVEDGATEIDMVLNIGWLKSGEIAAAQEDIQMVRQKIREEIALKVIIETCLLSEEEKVKACEISKKAGADFVKTSTGFSSGGATLDDVSLIRKVVGSELGVKASGGIKDYTTAIAMIKAGASRLGVSAGVAIVQGATK